VQIFGGARYPQRRDCGYDTFADRQRSGFDVHFYSETEFDMKNVMELPGRLMDTGPTYFHPDYRNGSAFGVHDWLGITDKICAIHFL
jgi:hypothetical protein